MLNTSNNRLTVSTLRFLQRVCDGNFVGKFLSGNTSGKGPTIDHTPFVFRPLDNCFGFSKSGQKSVVPSISSLLFGIGKFAIAWVVAFVVISSFNLQARTETVFGSPQLKYFEPSPLQANGDTPSSVTAIILAGFIKAAVHHAFPGFEQRILGIPLHREITFSGTEGLGGKHVTATIQTVLGSWEFFHSSPPCDIRLGLGETDIGVVSVQSREQTGSYPHNNNLTGGA